MDKTLARILGNFLAGFFTAAAAVIMVIPGEPDMTKIMAGCLAGLLQGGLAAAHEIMKAGEECPVIVETARTKAANLLGYMTI